VQRDATVAEFRSLFAERIRAAVLRIADDRIPARGGLDADLMSAARFEFNFEPRAQLASREHTIVQDGMLGRWVIGVDYFDLGHAMAFVKIVSPSAFLERDLSFDECPVDFTDGAVGELSAKLPSGTDVASEDERPGDGPIDAVDQAKINVVVRLFAFALTVEIFNPDFHAIDPARRLREQAGRFVDD